ncbi:DivIVA domain-containing protein [Amycolatopsis pithecellobii]|uniref:Cell wall synthesis protein Wag31 n=1 Tax=Amycolatopsis pithecellobii TaxID=664692 RepID=A0A6N7YP77_9PSEU|nr:DivIVA domain-containing protein [Amycolatopsis pithecellobii]MTD54805.1 DivIVA domain-containing protein [Amycolatopsis pithecellobii]
MSLTADDVNRVEFANAPIGRRGYAKQEVDAFVRRIAKTLGDEDDLTAAEVHHVEFNRPLLGKRGYDEREVDKFLDQAEDTLAQRSGEAHPLPTARTDAQATAGRAPSSHLRQAPLDTPTS